MQPFRDEQLNFFKFSSLVLNEFPKALRQTFKTMWDNTYGGRPGFQLWDDSTAVRNLFATTEGGRTKVAIHQSYKDWDCTNLFQATIFARSFALPASTGSSTLSDLYLKPRALPHGSFHACVLSPGGNNAETFTLAIDQLRRLRNSLCHSTSSEMDKLTFDQRVNFARDAFQALGVSTAPIDAVGSLAESDCERGWKFDQVTALLKDLHWLPVKHQLYFRLAVLVFKYMTGGASAYLTSKLVKRVAISTRTTRNSDDVDNTTLPHC